MPLPETIPAKISSEAAGYISMSPVARQELPLVDLVERILAVTGKDACRIREILARGSFVSGSSRYRWEAVEADEAGLGALLARFPDPEPERPFEASRCTLVVLRGARGTVEIGHEVAAKRRLLRRRNYWDVLIPSLAALSPRYDRYSYAERADVYVVTLPQEAALGLQQEAELLRYTTVIQQVRRLVPESAELFVER